MKESDQFDLFKWGRLPDGLSRRDAGFDQVLGNTPDDFKDRLSNAFWQLVRSGKRFTAEDARAFSGDPPNHPNAFGAAWNHLVFAAMREGRLKVVDHIKATRPSAQARTLPVYQAT